ncbi:hypothetical protein ZWY2020_058913 [Hordeum vulgare]|nr:hypothetical protein ZWY2020_058913 [Hordeum vulgare]
MPPSDPNSEPPHCVLTPPPDPATPLLVGPRVGFVEVTTPVAVHPDPPRTATFSRRVWSATTLVASTMHSYRINTARPSGCPAPSISELVDMRAATRNLEPGRLAKVVTDSAIVFRGEVGPP